MIDPELLETNPEDAIQGLKNFELFCLGEKNMSVEDFHSLNEILSISALLYVGRHRFQRREDGRHLLWTSPSAREYDLGPVEALDILREGPGFNKSKTLALGNNLVKKIDVLYAPVGTHPMTLVEMKDGTTGIGPDYKTALRNAALKMHLRKTFEKANQIDVWDRYYGHC